MTIISSGPERRRAARSRRSDAILWRLHARADFEMGWLLESSQTGFAFAWRGRSLPAVETEIEVQTELGDASSLTRRATIQRCEVVHDDLVILAAEYAELSVSAAVACAA